jgi:hypothetical protein
LTKNGCLEWLPAVAATPGVYAGRFRPFGRGGGLPSLLAAICYAWGVSWFGSSEGEGVDGEGVAGKDTDCARFNK